MLYEGDCTKEISFPLGGIGSGCIGLGGDGRLIDWEIFNRPSKGGRNGYSHFAVKAKNESGVFTRILNGDMRGELTGRYLGREFSGFGYGPESASLAGFPHFGKVSFKGEFPVAELTFSDENFPSDVRMTAFSPFIPLDADASSIPGAFFEIEITNETGVRTEYQMAFSLENPYDVPENTHVRNGRINAMTVKNAGCDPSLPGYGDLTVATDCDEVLRQTYWYRGGWQDSVVTYWNEFSGSEDLCDRLYDTPRSTGKDVCTLAAKATLAPGETKKFRFVLT